MALLVNLTLQTHPPKNGIKESDWAKPGDFMPRWGLSQTELVAEEQKRQSIEEMKKALLSIATLQNKRVERKKARRPPTIKTNKSIK